MRGQSGETWSISRKVHRSCFPPVEKGHDQPGFWTALTVCCPGMQHMGKHPPLYANTRAGRSGAGFEAVFARSVLNKVISVSRWLISTSPVSARPGKLPKGPQEGSSLETCCSPGQGAISGDDGGAEAPRGGRPQLAAAPYSGTLRSSAGPRGGAPFLRRLLSPVRAGGEPQLQSRRAGWAG